MITGTHGCHRLVSLKWNLLQNRCPIESFLRQGCFFVFAVMVVVGLWCDDRVAGCGMLAAPAGQPATQHDT